MHTYIHTHTNTYRQTGIQLHTNINWQIHIHAWILTHIHKSIHTRRHTYTQTYTQTDINKHRHAFTHTHVCMYIHSHLQTDIHTERHTITFSLHKHTATNRHTHSHEHIRSYINVYAKLSPKSSGFLVGWINFIFSFSLFLFCTKKFLLWAPVDCNSIDLYFYDLDCDDSGNLRESELKMFVVGVLSFLIAVMSFKLITGVKNVRRICFVICFFLILNLSKRCHQTIKPMKSYYQVMTIVLAIFILPCLGFLGMKKAIVLCCIVGIHGYIYRVLSYLYEIFECEYQYRVMGQVSPNTALISLWKSW
jgi:hypothetical protein